MMNPELKKQWLEALRSGKYEQGQKVLRSEDDKYCCMGVLCDLMKPDGWKREGPGLSFMFVSDTFESVASIHDENILSFNQREELIKMNDNRRLSFDEIADWIEEEVLTDESRT